MARSMLNSARRFLRDESGPTSVEYAVILMMIFLACITVVQLIGRALNESFTDSSGQLNDAFNK